MDVRSGAEAAVGGRKARWVTRCRGGAGGGWRIQGAGAVAEAGGGVCGGATGKTGARAPRPVCWDRVGGSVSPRQPGVLARPGQGVVRWVR